MDHETPASRHPTLYFSDGDVVLSAADETPSQVLFRVDKLFLSRHSEIFRNLFGDAIDSGQETYDGVPLVPMIGDKAKDLALLIEVIYDPSALYNLLDNTPPADLPLRVGGLADIAQKYIVGKIKESIVAKIESQWPTTLEAWDAQRASMLHAQEQNDMVWFDQFGAAFPEPVSAIIFAQKHDVPSVLPAAFYRLSFTRFGHHYGAEERFPEDRYGAENLPTARWKLLDADTLRRFLAAKEYLLQNFQETLDGQRMLDKMMVVPRPLGRCYREVGSGESSCVWNKDDIQARIAKLVATNLSFVDIDALGFLKKLQALIEEQTFCRSCKMFLVDDIEASRRKLWTLMSGWFTAPPEED